MNLYDSSKWKESRTILQYCEIFLQMFAFTNYLFKIEQIIFPIFPIYYK